MNLIELIDHLNMENENQKNACVVVLGDIGRSPRMQYHSKSLAEHGYKVDIICYQETQPMSALSSEPQVYFHYLVPYPNLPLPRILNYLFKTIWQFFTLLFVLLIIRRPNVVLVQNPPAVPALIVCWLFCALTKTKYIIDWHNYAFSIMTLNVGKEHLLVKLTKKIEVFAGSRATHNFCVTKEMLRDLKDTWNINAITLYDRPPDIFQPITIKQKHDILKQLAAKYDEFKGENDSTIVTKVTDNQVILKGNRPGIIISSTSWTEDEDFSILLEALNDYDEHIRHGNSHKLPDLLCIITGKGPLKEFYCEQIQDRKWENVKCITPWLESSEYPLLLASADLGVCLHTSSSGLDLPMKVVDMFGCGIPVCAHAFRCLNELVKHKENGFIFQNAEELGKQLQNWFTNFPNNQTQLELYNKFRENLDIFQDLRWRENWDLVAFNTFK